MEEAIRLATESARSALGGPFGAVIVKNGTIIARGTNLVTSTRNPTAHAEVNAIVEACRMLDDFELKGCELYASCEPCPMCLGAIFWARLERVYFAATRIDASNAGFDDQLFYEESEKLYSDRRVPFEQVMHEEALAAFQAWNENGKRTGY
jgi:guanine deaminase